MKVAVSFLLVESIVLRLLLYRSGINERNCSTVANKHVCKMAAAELHLNDKVLANGKRKMVRQNG